MGNSLEVVGFVFGSAKQTAWKTNHEENRLLGYLLRWWAWREEAKLAGPCMRDKPELDLDVGPCEKGLKIRKTGLDWAQMGHVNWAQKTWVLGPIKQ